MEQALIGVSQDLRSAGSVLVLMNRGIRNGVGELIMRVDQYNSLIETIQPGSDKIVINDQLRDDLRKLNALGMEICAELRAIMDNEP